MQEQPSPERNCGCQEPIVECSHLGEYRVIFLHDDDGYFAAMCRKGAFLTASVATGAEAEMREHFRNLDALMRAGTMQKLMEYADVD